MPVQKMKKDLQQKATAEEIALLGIDYANKKTQIKVIDSECKKQRVTLESYLKANGVETPNGSINSVIQHADMDVVLKNTLRTSYVLLPTAVEVLLENGLGECIENVPIVREDVLSQMHSEGKVPDGVLQKVYQVNKSYAFSVEVKPRYEAED